MMNLQGRTKAFKLTVLIGVILAAVLVLSACAGGLGLDRGGEEAAAVEVVAEPEAESAVEPEVVANENSPAADDARSKGAADAPITIVEYSDFQCPYCASWVLQTYPALVEEYIDSGKARLVFRDFPLSFHPNAQPAAVAARCAGEQDGFWDIHDLLFERQSDWADLEDVTEAYAGYASEIGLDVDAFGECLASGKYDGEIEQDFLAGQAAGVSGTPSFLINGQLLVGAQPLARFRDALDTVMAGGNINEQAQQPQEAPEPVEIDIEGAPVKGDPDAPITIVEYSDYQCPFCSRFVIQTMPALVEEFIDTGKAKLVFKDFPLTSIHPQAEKASEAARCVRELAGDSDDAYWKMHDLLFGGQEEWSGQAEASAFFAEYAVEAGADESAFIECLDSGRYTEAVRADLQEGAGLGVNGTPTFFINGQPFVGAQPIAAFQDAIAKVERGESIVPPTPPTPTPRPTPGPLAEPISLEDAAGIKGDTAAPITIVEYSDYECPFCRQHSLTTMPALQRYIDAGQVQYVFKDFPLTSIHPRAVLAAVTARCAGDQDSYWPMHDLLFERQEEWARSADGLASVQGLADELGLDRTQFDACLDDPQAKLELVEANFLEALGYNLGSTPSFYINGRPLIGAYPSEQFEAIIEAELDKQ